MRSVVLAIAATFAVASPIVAQQSGALPGVKDAARVTGGTYTADAAHSLIKWQVNHFGFNDYFGLLGDVAGTLTIDPKNPAAAKVDVTIPVSKIMVASPGLNKHLLAPGKEGGKPDFFGPNPADARFVSNHVVVKGTNATIHGNLTLNGVTKPVTLEAQFTGAGANPMSKKETVGFHGAAKIKRSEFNVMGALPVVSDEVSIDVTIAFEKA